MIRRLADVPDLIEKIRVRSAVALLLAVAQSAFLLPIALLIRRVFNADVPHDDQLGCSWRERSSLGAIPPARSRMSRRAPMPRA
jgi:hypothetical protein